MEAINPATATSEGTPYVGTNGIAGAAFSAIESYGFTCVAVWPQSPFMDDTGIVPAGDDWYALLESFPNQ